MDAIKIINTLRIAFGQVRVKKLQNGDYITRVFNKDNNNLDKIFVNDICEGVWNIRADSLNHKNLCEIAQENGYKVDVCVVQMKYMINEDKEQLIKNIGLGIIITDDRYDNIVFVDKGDWYMRVKIKDKLQEYINNGYSFGKIRLKSAPELEAYVYNKMMDKYCKEDRLLYTNMPHLYETECKYAYVLKQNDVYYIKQRPESQYIKIDPIPLARHCKIPLQKLEPYSIEIVKAERAYVRDNFVNSYSIKSCMWNQPVGDFYEKYGAQAVILKYKEEWIGRTILWDYEGMKLTDRLYCEGRHYNVFMNLIKKAGFGFIVSYEKGFNYKGTLVKPTIKPVNNKAISFYPYMDNIRYIDDNGVISMNNISKYIMDNTDGIDPRENIYTDVDGNTFHESDLDNYIMVNGEYYHEDDYRIVYAEDAEEVILRDDAYECVITGKFYARRRSVVQLYNGDYVSTYCVEDGQVVEVDGEYYLKEDVEYSEFDERYALKEDIARCSYSGITFIKNENEWVKFDNDYYLLKKCPNDMIVKYKGILYTLKEALERKKNEKY